MIALQGREAPTAIGIGWSGGESGSWRGSLRWKGKLHAMRGWCHSVGFDGWELELGNSCT